MNTTSTGTINRQPSKAALDATHLLWLLDEWLTFQASDVAPDTLADYRRKTDYFRHWWTAEGPARQWQLTKHDLQRFELYLRTRPAKQTGQPLAWHTRNDALRRLKEMFAWAHRDEYTDLDYSKWIPTAHGAPEPRTAATTKQLHQLLTACQESDRPTRNAAILAILIGTGIRRTECSNIQREHLIFHADGSGLIDITGKRTKANPSGKRQVAFDATTGAYLRTYLDESYHDDGPLFLADDGQALATQGIYKVVKRVIYLANLEKLISGPHDLRRAFATHFARAHPDAIHADMLRRQLGHAHYSQTASYTLLDASDLVGHIHSPLADSKKKANTVSVLAQ